MKNREIISLDNDWKFHQGDIISIRNRWAWGKSGSWNQGPESRQQDDTDWETVNIPHDFVIRTQPYEYSKQEFNKDNVIPLMEDVGNIHTTAGSFKKDVGWYRKRFNLSNDYKNKKIYLIFDGIYRDSMIFLNEFFITAHRSGYSGIKADITDFVDYDGENLLVVKADAREAEGWFYEGGGIYRHAYLLVTENEHIEDVYINYELDVDNLTAEIKIETELENPDDANLSIVTEIYDMENNVIKTVEHTNLSCTKCQMTNVNLWDTENPYLYTFKTTLFKDGKECDSYSLRTGLRTVLFTAEKGFFLNGKNMKLKGVCCHQNHGGLGTALPDEIYTYRIKKLKEMGVNAYRCAHYPQSKELMAACDELGMLVMDENRLFSSAKEDIEQLEFMVKRDRNCPSVILYSIGNEEAQSQTSVQNGRIARSMVKAIKKLDKKTPVTMAVLMWNLRDKCPIDTLDDISRITNELDVAGFNYHAEWWDGFHNEFPLQPMVSTEQGTFKSTRGCYDKDDENCHLNMLDEYNRNKNLSGTKKWKDVMAADYMSGLFLWTGFDYYGEPTPYAWPAISSQFGIMDICGYPKDFYYYYKGIWTDESVVHISSHWNFKEGQVRDISVFSDCDEVELFVNGKTYGKKEMEKYDFLIWEGVEYEPGEIVAVGYKNGAEAAKHTVVTTDTADSVKLTADFTKDSLVIIRADIIDKNGSTVPYANDGLEFIIEGNGEVIGTSNGNPSDHTPAYSNKRNAFNGLAQAIIKRNGKIKVTAKSDTVKGCSIDV